MYSKKDFIKDAKLKHKNKYDYSKVIYKNKKTNVIIICSVHGEFEQKPYLHLSTNGCKKCNIVNGLYSKKKKSTEQFIIDAKKIHGDKYNYSLVDYVNNKTKVKIICSIHGIFEQRPDTHLNNNCYKCGRISSRLKTIKRIKKNKLNGNQLVPNYNSNACDLFDKISKQKNIYIQHAKNDGEYFIKELGYWLDGYDKENNIVYEFDEEYHKYQIEKDIIRQNEIINYLTPK